MGSPRILARELQDDCKHVLVAATKCTMLRALRKPVDPKNPSYKPSLPADQIRQLSWRSLGDLLSKSISDQKALVAALETKHNFKAKLIPDDQPHADRIPIRRPGPLRERLVQLFSQRCVRILGEDLEPSSSDDGREEVLPPPQPTEVRRSLFRPGVVEDDPVHDEHAVGSPPCSQVPSGSPCRSKGFAARPSGTDSLSPTAPCQRTSSSVPQSHAAHCESRSSTSGQPCSAAQRHSSSSNRSGQTTPPSLGLDVPRSCGKVPQSPPAPCPTPSTSSGQPITLSQGLGALRSWGTLSQSPAAQCATPFTTSMQLSSRSPGVAGSRPCGTVPQSPPVKAPSARMHLRIKGPNSASDVACTKVLPGKHRLASLQCAGTEQPSLRRTISEPGAAQAELNEEPYQELGLASCSFKRPGIGFVFR